MKPSECCIRSETTRQLWASISLLVVAVAASACGFSARGLAFRNDHRLTITSPEDRATVTLPVKIDWTVKGFRVVEPGAPLHRDDTGHFGVYIDQSPQPPGELLAWFGRNDFACERDPRCPDSEYLTGRGVRSTTGTTITIETLPRPENEKRREFHEVTIAFLDPTGARIGETAFRIRFEVVRQEEL